MSTEEETEIRPLSEIFDDGFQAKLLAHMIRDKKFMVRAGGLVDPHQFENAAHACLARMAKRHYELFDEIASIEAFARTFKKECDAKVIRAELIDDCKEAIRAVFKSKLTDHEYMVNEVATFARHTAIDLAMEKAYDLKNKGNFEKAEQLLQEAFRVGAADDSACYDYFESAADRRSEREAYATGEITHNGVTTGLDALNALLYHKGWGRREMTLLMGGLKSGKSIGLGYFAINAALASENVLNVTLEVHRDIIADRTDAKVTGTPMSELEAERDAVFDKVESLVGAGKVGKYIIAERMGANFTPVSLRQLIEDYRAQGILFDMVVLDYLDLCKPTHRTTDPRHDDKIMYTEFRALADEYDFALLSATQTNRSGMGSETADATHVADNIEKLRIADLTISINATEDEKSAGEARLFFAASRNQAGSISVLIKQDLDRMKFIDRIKDVS